MGELAFFLLVFSAAGLAGIFDSRITVSNGDMRDKSYVAGKIQMELGAIPCGRTQVKAEASESKTELSFTIQSDGCKIIEKGKACDKGLSVSNLSGYGGEKYQICHIPRPAAKAAYSEVK